MRSILLTRHLPRTSHAVDASREMHLRIHVRIYFSFVFYLLLFSETSTQLIPRFLIPTSFTIYFSAATAEQSFFFVCVLPPPMCTPFIRRVFSNSRRKSTTACKHGRTTSQTLKCIETLIQEKKKYQKKMKATASPWMKSFPPPREKEEITWSTCFYTQI